MKHELNDLGFRSIAKWTLDGPSIRLDLNPGETWPPDLHVLYAFCIRNEVKYMGKTRRGIRARLCGYQNPGPDQRTNVRVNGEIKAALEGESVEILLFQHPPGYLLQWGTISISLPAGLEDALIEHFDPLWNGGRLDVDRPPPPPPPLPDGAGARGRGPGQPPTTPAAAEEPDEEPLDATAVAEMPDRGNDDAALAVGPVLSGRSQQIIARLRGLAVEEGLCDLCIGNFFDPPVQNPNQAANGPARRLADTGQITRRPGICQHCHEGRVCNFLPAD